MEPLESYCSLHCTFVFCSKLQQQQHVFLDVCNDLLGEDENTH